MEPRPADRVPALTGLRFAAALGILFFHHGGPILAGAPAWAERIRTGGYVWVSLFFLLSGFVLARAHAQPMASSERRAFWAARLARLYPAYLLAFLLAAPFALQRWAAGGSLGSAKAAAVAAATLLLVQAWIPPIARLWNAPGWSTSVVLAFYAGFPFAVARLSRLSRRGLWGALGLAWGLSLAFPLLWLWLRPDGPVADPTWQEPRWLLALKFHPVARAGEFLAGVSLGLLQRRGLVHPLPSAAAPAALVAAIAVLAWGGAPYPALHNGLLTPLFAVAVIALAQGAGPLARALASRPARVLGDAAFAVYALQEPLWLWCRRLGAAPHAPASLGFTVLFMAGTIGLAVAVSRGLERPARRALRTMLGGAPQPPSRAGRPAPQQA